MTADGLLQSIRDLSDIKIKRLDILKNIHSCFKKVEINFESLKKAVSDEKELISTKGYLIQFLAKISQYQPVMRGKAISFIRIFLKENRKTLDLFLLESIIFFFYLVDRTILLSLNFDDDKYLAALKTKFLFIDENLSRKFSVPQQDLMQGKRLLNFDRLCENLSDCGDLMQFKSMINFLFFTASFPFINDIKYIKTWSAIEDKQFLSELINSRIFIHDGSNIIYDPVERVKTEKFIHDVEFQEKIISKIRDKKEDKEKKVIFDSFVDNFLTMTELFIDTGICIVGYNNQLKFNKFALNNLEIGASNSNYVFGLIDKFKNDNRNIERLIINGINIESKITKLVIEGKEIGFVIVFRDLTEEELYKKFSGHDIKNSILSVISTFQLLKFSDNLEEDEVRCIESGEKSINNLKEKFDDLLSFRKDNLELNDDIDMNNIINRCLITFNSNLAIKNMRVNFINGEAINLLKCDEKKISRVFENIISNAIKYSPESTTITIKITSLNNGKEIAVSVKDEGYGIEDIEGNNIFNVGKRLERDKQVEGSGIGLAVVKKFISMHGGSISFKNNINKGTTFRITLPTKYDIEI